MNIFTNIYSRWTFYEWSMIIVSLVIFFIIIILFSYFIVKRIKVLIPITLTFIFASLLYTLLLLIYTSAINISISNLSMLPIPLIIILITINWVYYIYEYSKKIKSKKFSIVKLQKEYEINTMGQIVIITLPCLLISIFLFGEQIAVLLSVAIVSSVAIYLNTFLVKKIIHD